MYMLHLTTGVSSINCISSGVNKNYSTLKILGENRQFFISYVIIVDTNSTTRYLVILNKKERLTSKHRKPVVEVKTIGGK